MNRLLHHQHKKMITDLQHTKYCSRKNRIKSKLRFFVQNRIEIDRMAKISYRHSTMVTLEYDRLILNVYRARFACSCEFMSSVM